MSLCRAVGLRSCYCSRIRVRGELDVVVRGFYRGEGGRVGEMEGGSKGERDGGRRKGEMEGEKDGAKYM